MKRERTHIQKAVAAKLEGDFEYCLMNNRQVILPRLFSRTFGGRFRECVACGEGFFKLQDGLPVPVPYLVVKEHRGQETILEYALCLECLQKLESTYSQDTTLCMQHLFASRMDFRRRFDRLVRRDAPWEAWIEHCVLNEGAPTGAARWTLAGLCVRDRLVLSGFPYVICDRGLDLLEECFSQRTKKIRRRFIKRNLGLERALYGRRRTS